MQLELLQILENHVSDARTIWMTNASKAPHSLALPFPILPPSWRVSKEQSLFQIEFPYHDLKEEVEAALFRLVSDSDSGGEPNTEWQIQNSNSSRRRGQ